MTHEWGNLYITAMNPSAPFFFPFLRLAGAAASSIAFFGQAYYPTQKQVPPPPGVAILPTQTAKELTEGVEALKFGDHPLYARDREQCAKAIDLSAPDVGDIRQGGGLGAALSTSFMDAKASRFPRKSARWPKAAETRPRGLRDGIPAWDFPPPDRFLRGLPFTDRRLGANRFGAVRAGGLEARRQIATPGARSGSRGRNDKADRVGISR